MRFLLNMNVSRELGRRLAVAGHEWQHVGDIGLAQASDRTILEHARAISAVIVTHDLDYGHLLAFSGQVSPSVIILRTRTVHADYVARRIAQVWPQIEEPLSEGAIVALEDTLCRIRKLPILRSDLSS